jgi:DNA-binding MltR family transcriptional regulator
MAKFDKIPPISDLGTGWDDIIQEFNDEPSHRALVVLAVGYLDDLLASTLKHRFVPNKVGTETPAARALPRGLEARLDLCFAMGLVDEDVYHDVMIMAQVRNRFAHVWRKLDLSTPDVAALVEQLRAARQVFPTEELVPRARFSTAALLIMTRLILQGHRIEQLKPASAVPVVQIKIGGDETPVSHATTPT